MHNSHSIILFFSSTESGSTKTRGFRSTVFAGNVQAAYCINIKSQCCLLVGYYSFFKLACLYTHICVYHIIALSAINAALFVIAPNVVRKVTVATLHFLAYGSLSPLAARC